MNTPTPRTDAYYAEWQESWSREDLSLDLCRQLERENAQLYARLKELKEDEKILDWLENHPSSFTRWWEIPVEGESLRDAIRSAMNHKTK
jgi:hypothetical protein